MWAGLCVPMHVSCLRFNMVEHETGKGPHPLFLSFSHPLSSTNCLSTLLLVSAETLCLRHQTPAPSCVETYSLFSRQFLLPRTLLYVRLGSQLFSLCKLILSSCVFSSGPLKLTAPVCPQTNLSSQQNSIIHDHSNAFHQDMKCTNI